MVAIILIIAFVIGCVPARPDFKGSLNYGGESVYGGDLYSHVEASYKAKIIERRTFQINAKASFNHDYDVFRSIHRTQGFSAIELEF